MTRRRRPLVLMYHAVGRRPPVADPYNLFVPVGSLWTQLAGLLGRGWRPLRLAEYLAGAGAGAGAGGGGGGGGVGGGDGRRFLVTFDDGYRCVYETALPVLTELGVPATVFVCAGMLGQASAWMPELPGEPLMTGDQVRRCRAAGMDVGLHGMDHTPLVGLPDAELRRQTGRAADLLSQVTGEWPAAFAYPCGAHDARARAAVAAAGLRVAFATHRGSGPLAVPRVDVNATDTERTFGLKTWRGYPPLRRVAGAVPGLRPVLHVLLGDARYPRNRIRASILSGRQ